MNSPANPALATKVDRSRLIRAAVPALGLFWLVVTTLPFIFVVMTSLKSQQETFSGSVWSLPEKLNFENYLAVLNGGFWTYLRNSVFVLVTSIILILVISSMAAYAFARLRFRLNKPLFGLIVAGMIVPIHITLIPIYLLIRNVGLYDTPFALIGPYVATALPVSIFILTEFMRQIPKELEEAAKLDGCGAFGIFWKVFLPLSGNLEAQGAARPFDGTLEGWSYAPLNETERAARAVLEAMAARG